MILPKMRRIYVMPKEQMHMHFTNDTYTTLSKSMFMGRVATDTAPTPADAAGVVVGGGWHEIPTYTRSHTYIHTDDIIVKQIRRNATISAVDVDCSEIRIPHGYTLLTREIDGHIQYALVSTNGVIELK